MKSLSNPNVKSSQADLALLIVRIGITSLMLTHGLPKLQQFFSDEPIQFIGLFGMNPTMALALAVFAEVFCSIAIFLGLFTRLATIPLLVTMFIAVLFIHANDPFARQELGLLYITVYILLLITGPGKYSVDRYIYNQK
jgi:putative oxidoreductase